MGTLLAICSSNFFAIMSDGRLGEDENFSKVVKVTGNWAGGIIANEETTKYIIEEINKRPAYKDLPLERLLVKLSNTLKKLPQTQEPIHFYLGGNQKGQGFSLNILSTENNYEPRAFIPPEGGFEVKMCIPEIENGENILNDLILSKLPPTGTEKLAADMHDFIKAIAEKSDKSNSNSYQEFVFPW